MVSPFLALDANVDSCCLPAPLWLEMVAPRKQVGWAMCCALMCLI